MQCHCFKTVRSFLGKGAFANAEAMVLMEMKRIISVLLITVVLFAAALTACSSKTTEFTGTYYADITVKDYGTITVALDGNAGFYDGLTFHRIIEGFMMQGGDPSGNGTGGSGKSIIGEFAANGVDNDLSHTRGAISMARRGNDMNSATSQFFIVHEDSTFSLDGQYACFGYVTEGMDVVDAICEDAKPIDNNGTIVDVEQPVIESIVIREAD